jgi:nitronate monooxygenase
MSSLCSLLGIVVPIIQAPTGSVAGPELAAAVSQAGGLGSLGVTWASESDLSYAMRSVKRATNLPFMVNYALSFDPSTLDLALQLGAPVVSFSWGSPDVLVERVNMSGALVGVQVANAGGAKRALDSGADFLICQGLEAGGHVQSTRPLYDVLESVRSVAGTEVPLVAAGGLATGKDIADAIRAGADGVMIGTRFVATQESRAHEVYKQLLVEAGEASTALTVCFDGGWPHAPHRALRNSTLEAWETAGCPPPGTRPGEGDVLGHTEAGSSLLRYEDTAPRKGMEADAEAMALYAGTGVARIAELPNASDLVRSLWGEAQSLLGQNGAPGRIRLPSGA